MSPWLGIVPILIVEGIGLESKATFGSGGQVVEPLLHLRNDEHNDSRSGCEGRLNLDPSLIAHFNFNFQGGLWFRLRCHIT